jgi:DNA-binding transcriptional MerR regulator
MPEPGPAHLSIGEVLGLLLEEFPDITISKIRFLESQGLIEPERTPSGYRKFFADDVELLRVILREQRENFLPLRVIKDRIDSGQLDPTPPRGHPDGSADEADQAELAKEIAAHPSSGKAPVPSVAPTATIATTGATAAAGADAAASPDSPAPPAGSAAASSTGTGEPAGAAGPPVSSGEARSDVDWRDRARDADERAAARPAGPLSSPSTSGVLAGVLLNREELCAMAGVTPAELAQLEEYGIVTKRGNASELYGEEAVEIATAAAKFLRAGVDARHLRTWRHSVEREAGLFEQIVLPLMRHRNPQARGQVIGRLEELDALSTRLRAALMRASLRRYFES